MAKTVAKSSTEESGQENTPNSLEDHKNSAVRKRRQMKNASQAAQEIKQRWVARVVRLDKKKIAERMQQR